MSMAPVVKLHIESLLLDGLGDVPRSALARAVRAELARRLGADGEQAIRWTAGHRASIDGGTIDASTDAPVSQLGARIGTAVHHGITSR